MPHQAANYCSVNFRQVGHNNTMQLTVFPLRLRLRSKAAADSGRSAASQGFLQLER
jgi:hypothetical protein